MRIGVYLYHPAGVGDIDEGEIQLYNGSAPVITRDFTSPDTIWCPTSFNPSASAVLR